MKHVLEQLFVLGALFRFGVGQPALEEGRTTMQEPTTLSHKVARKKLGRYTSAGGSPLARGKLAG